MPEQTPPDPVVVAPAPAAVARLLAVSATLGAVVALGFQAFAWSSDELLHLIWIDWAGEHPAAWVTMALATAGGLALGVTLKLVPGHGGPHPGDGHGLVPEMEGGGPTAIGIVVAGFVSLVAGASLGPEGAVIPATAAFATIVAGWARMKGPETKLLVGAALAALLATMFGSPLAGAVPLMEIAGVSGFGLTMAMLPALTASATAVMTLRVIGSGAIGAMDLTYDGWQAGHLVWAVAVGVVAGALGVLVDWSTPHLRRFVARVEAHSLLLVTTLGGAVLGLTYVIGGDDIRFRGVPELGEFVAGDPSAGAALLAVAMKVVALTVCLAVGYRGGKIFPLVFIGGAAGLAVHLIVPAVPLSVGVAAGLAGTIAAGLRAPVIASVIAAAVVGPDLLPLAIVAVVAAHAVHLLAD
ncbi:MAG: chloride channel protein, partial [Microthrixaceae bacterium]|nr:chloride channel protein [Microthrixaceae bacterium]